jgi:AcrR family transcriptional regulator
VGERRRAGTATKGDQREQAILAAAEEQLATTGPDGLTVESLARAAGITRGSFYFYFGSKDDVLAALVGRTMAKLTGEVAAAETIADPATALRRAVDHTAQQWYDHGRLLRLAVDLSPTVPEIDAQWRDAIAHTVTTTTAIAVRADLPDDDGPTGARAVTTTLVWMTERAFYQAATTGAPPIPEVARTCTTIWLRTLNLS